MPRRHSLRGKCAVVTTRRGVTCEKDAPHRASPLVPWSSLGAILGGPLFAAWGYFHRDHAPPQLDAIANALSVVVPLLFLLGLAGFHIWRPRLAGRQIGRAGSALALAGCGLGALYHLAVVFGAANIAERYGYAKSQGWPPQLLDWFPWLLLGLTLMAVAYARVGSLRAWRFLPLAMAVFGWIYYFSDFGSAIQMRTTHVLFGLLFGLSWVLLGCFLWLNRVEEQGKDPRA